MFLRLNLKLNFLLKTKLRPGLNVALFVRRNDEKKAEVEDGKSRHKKIVNYFTAKSKCRSKKTPTEAEVFKFTCNAITL